MGFEDRKDRKHWIFPKDPRLKLRWKYVRIAAYCDEEWIKKQKRGFQTSEAKMASKFSGSDSKKPWRLRAVEWSGDYEAKVFYGDEQILSKRGFSTRLEAQIGAEKMLFEFLMKEYNNAIARLGTYMEVRERTSK